MSPKHGALTGAYTIHYVQQQYILVDVHHRRRRRQQTNGPLLEKSAYIFHPLLFGTRVHSIC